MKYRQDACFGASLPCPDKRSEPRIATQAFKVRVDGGCQSIYGFARDISRSGMQIRTFSLWPPATKEAGEKIRIEFSLPFKDKDIELGCRASVVWNLVPTEGLETITLQGVRFEDMDPAAQEKINAWISTSAPIA